MVDGSQSVPHIPVDIEQIQCDALVMTGHKMMAQT
jgi:cysteine desulfurase/selenocysteine lyase